MEVVQVTSVESNLLLSAGRQSLNRHKTTQAHLKLFGSVFRRRKPIANCPCFSSHRSRKMALKIESSNHTNSPCTPLRHHKPLVIFWLTMFLMLSAIGHADTNWSALKDTVSIESVFPSTKDGYGYKLQYYVPVRINDFWQFKTDFKSDILLTNNELIEHRVVRSTRNSVITENRYATAPGLRFLWQTTVFGVQYRLEFRLLNAEDCRHDFHYGTIQLSPHGNYTRITQTAFFNFRGASFWVKYPRF